MRVQLVTLLAACAAANPLGNSVARSTMPKEAGAVFAMNNDPNDNKVIAFSRAADGSLTQVGKYSTGGRGQGVDLDTQGGLILNKDGTFLYAVNPASDIVTVFSTKGSSLSKVQEIYAGDQPVAISLSTNGFAYVLDGSVASTGVFGFKVDQHKGTLTPLTNKTVSTSTPIGVPGSVVFSPDNKSLVVTNKVGSTLDVFKVGSDGKVGSGPATVSSSSGLRPFAATFDKNGNLFVIESGLPVLGNAAVSTYKLNSGSTPSLSAVTPSEKNGQTDGCWIVTTPDGKWAYTANFVSGTVSSYATHSNGTVQLVKGDAFSDAMSQPVDLALSGDGKFLYNLLRGSGGVIGWKIQEDGSLKQAGKITGQGDLLANFGVSGLAAY